MNKLAGAKLLTGIEPTISTILIFERHSMPNQHAPEIEPIVVVGGPGAIPLLKAAAYEKLSDHLAHQPTDDVVAQDRAVRRFRALAVGLKNYALFLMRRREQTS
jgi:hypothetical protein